MSWKNIDKNDNGLLCFEKITCCLSLGVLSCFCFSTVMNKILNCMYNYRTLLRICDVMFKTRAAVFYRDFKTTRRS